MAQCYRIERPKSRTLPTSPIATFSDSDLISQKKIKKNFRTIEVVKASSISARPSTMSR